MIISVNLSHQHFAKLGVDEILLPEKKVLVKLTSADYSNGTFVITVANEEEKRQYKTTGSAIDITELCQKAGFIKMEISKVIMCEPVKTWRTESLLLREIKHGLEAIPELELIKEELGKIKSAIGEIAVIIDESNTM